MAHGAAVAPLVAFAVPARASRAPAGRLWAEGVATHLGLAVRVADHTGEITMTSDVVSGVAVNEASRLLALAGSGQILLSPTAAGLARDAAVAFEDVGERRLRGIEAPMQVFTVVG
jgi:class 3 adenylate cyclase